jgi:hypothetical protein
MPETEHKEQVLQFAPMGRVEVQEMQIASGLAFPVAEAEVKGPPLPVFMNGCGVDAGLSFSTPVAPLIAKELPGSLLPTQMPPCPEMKEVLPTHVTTCTLPAAVGYQPCKLGLSEPVRSTAPFLPLPLNNRQVQSPGLHYVFNVECFTLPGSSA